VPLCNFDENILDKNKGLSIIGTDEAGRGPLAGPVTACAAWIPLNSFKTISPVVNDSKKLSPIRRESAIKIMIGAGVRFGFGYSSAAQIDRINILEATFNAMRDAVLRLLNSLGQSSGEVLLLVDGPHAIKRMPGFKQNPIKGGDSKSLSIAAASIFAKVIRDRWMRILDNQYPGYGFAAHKGYGTASHIAAIERLGMTEEHRRTFSPVRRLCGSAK